MTQEGSGAEGAVETAPSELDEMLGLLAEDGSLPDRMPEPRRRAATPAATDEEPLEGDELPPEGEEDPEGDEQPPEGDDDGDEGADTTRAQPLPETNRKIKVGDMELDEEEVKKG